MGDIVSKSEFVLNPVTAPEYRCDPITGIWSIIAPERAKRLAIESENRSRCPFCAGNESLTLPEVFAFRAEKSIANDSNWRVRVIDNLYPAVRLSSTEVCYQPNDCPDHVRTFGGGCPAQGFHEVIIEGPEHERSFVKLSKNLFREVILSWKQRLLFYHEKKEIGYVQIFKNHGPEAGASLEHSHSQLIALSDPPGFIAEEIRSGKDYYQQHDRCTWCDWLKKELDLGIRIVAQNHSCVAISANAARWPFETWILPRTHFSHLEFTSEEIFEDFIALTQNVLLGLHHALLDPPYNLVLHSGPMRCKNLPSFHWHLEILPRLTQPGGFEWATGRHINPVPPEQAAKFLHRVISGE